MPNKRLLKDQPSTKKCVRLRPQNSGGLISNQYRATLILSSRRQKSVNISYPLNCAHCHNPARWDEATDREFDFRYATPFGETGLQHERRKLSDALESGEMPYLGTTLLHEGGVALVLEYLETL